jgi:hypothetical protein
MYITTFERKNVRGKPQWVCIKSEEYFSGRDLMKNLTFEAFSFLRLIYAFTENQVNLGSCKKPHRYIKFGFGHEA